MACHVLALVTKGAPGEGGGATTSWVIMEGSGTAPGTSVGRLWNFLVSLSWLESEFLSQLVQWL